VISICNHQTIVVKSEVREHETDKTMQMNSPWTTGPLQNLRVYALLVFCRDQTFLTDRQWVVAIIHGS
jgi:hypothetical protein